MKTWISILLLKIMVEMLSNKVQIILRLSMMAVLNLEQMREASQVQPIQVTIVMKIQLV